MSDEMQFSVEKSPIDRQTLLAEANAIIKSHDDYLHGMAADDVEQKNGVLVFRGEFFLDENGLPTLKPPPCSICSSIWRMCCRKNTIWSINDGARDNPRAPDGNIMRPP